MTSQIIASVVKRTCVCGLLLALVAPDREPMLTVRAHAQTQTHTAGPVLADIQIVAIDEREWVVRLTSSEEQAFDELAAEDNVRVVRLHAARLASSLAPLAPASFGRISAVQGENAVDVRLEVDDTTFSIDVRQGGSPNLVEVRISRR